MIGIEWLNSESLSSMNIIVGVLVFWAWRVAVVNKEVIAVWKVGFSRLVVVLLGVVVGVSL